MNDRAEEAASEHGPAAAPGPGAMPVAIGVEGLGRAAKAAASKAESAKSSELVDAQTQLARTQARMLHAQLADLERSRGIEQRHSALRFFRERLHVLLELIAVAFGVMVLVGFAAMVWTAHESRGLVVEAFSVPPDLAQSGLTGQVVAARVLDRLRDMQALTASERPAASYVNDWGGDLKLEIPDTGLTLEQLDKFLRARLGHASRITGEVFHTPTGIALSTRLDTTPAQTFVGAAGAIDDLARQSAEAIYRADQPYRYAEYLAGLGRRDEAFAALSELATHGPISERPWAFTAWGYHDLTWNGDVAAARRHIMASFGYPLNGDTPHGYLQNVDFLTGNDEGSYRDSQLSLDELRESRGQLTPAALDLFSAVDAIFIAHLSADYAAAARLDEAAAQKPTSAGDINFAGPAVSASDYALARDVASARRAIAPLAPADDTPFLAADIAGAWWGAPVYRIAWAEGDWPAALADARACDAWLEARKADVKAMGLMQQVFIRPLEALALSRTGDVAGAEALIATTPGDCYLCLRVRGQVAAAKGDWPAAERWFALAAALAPSLPTAHSEWGAERLAHGDLAGAIALFRIAHARSPRFADPVERWGEALLRQGDARGAADKFAEAARDAPGWGYDRMLWGEALARLGRQDAARAQYAAAAAAGLRPADAQTLAALRRAGR